MKSIKTIVLTFCISLIAVASIGIIGTLKVGIGKIQKFSTESVRFERMKGYDDSVKFQIQNAISILKTFYEEEQNGTLSHEQAQKEAIKIIKISATEMTVPATFGLTQQTAHSSPIQFFHRTKVKTEKILKTKTA